MHFDTHSSSYSEGTMTLESKLSTWAKGPSKTEEERCENALRMIVQAIDACPSLSKFSPKCSIKGSYKHKTNIRSNSDVDVGVMATACSWNNFGAGKTREDFGLSESSLSWADFKNETVLALKAKFPGQTVTKEDNCIKIRDNSYRVQADVVPCLRYKDWTINQVGTKFRTDSGSYIINWPNQDSENGKDKNKNTFRRYKRMVRLVKNLRKAMKDEGVFTQKVPSFFIECLVFNCPDSCFSSQLFAEMTYAVLAHIFSSNWQKHPHWLEVNKIKPLYSQQQKWTPKLAARFSSAGLEYLGFVNGN